MLLALIWFSCILYNFYMESHNFRLIEYDNIIYNRISIIALDIDEVSIFVCPVVHTR